MQTRRSLSLAAYLAFARRAEPSCKAADFPPRPEGELVWAHAVDHARVDALVQLAERLAQQRPGTHMLLTTKEEIELHQIDHPHIIRQRLCEDTLADAEIFLSHWRPGICLWTGGDLQPALLICADQMDIPLYLVDADEAHMDRSSWRWFPDLPRALLSRFAGIIARSEDAARILRRYGARDADIAITGPFQEGALSLPYNESDREELANLLRGRPIWLAAMIQLDELDTVLAAYRSASRLSHRMLLIIVPDKLSDAAEMKARLDAENLRYICWADGDLPQEITQVLLADTQGEMGLWYRIAPVSFIGSSLTPSHQGRDPNEPAAHGSAILYGPNVRRYLSRYSRFAEAGAARIVRDADTLAAAVERLCAADQAAKMAHAAWDVASKGAGVTDQILDLVQDTLDVLEAPK